MRVFTRIFSLFAALILVQSIGATEPQAADLARGSLLVPVEGKPFPTVLFSADAAGNFVWKRSSGGDGSQGGSDDVRLAARDMVRWGHWPEPAAGIRVLLNDGGRVIGHLLRWDENGLELESDEGLSAVKIPRGAIRALVWLPRVYAAAEREQAEQLMPAVSDSPAPYQVLLANGDQRSGAALTWLAKQWTLTAAAGPLTLEANAIAAIKFAPPEKAKSSGIDKDAAVAAPRFWLGFRDGSRILAESLERVGESWRIKCNDGASFTAEAAALVAVQPLGGRATYLSGLEPSGFKHLPWLTIAWDYQRDRNVLGGELAVAGERSLKGLGMHSAARLTYPLDGKYDRFAAAVGIDDATRGRGAAVARVYGDDGSGEWKLLYESPVLRGRAAAVPVEVSIGGLKRLSLLVDFGEGGDELDHVDWLDARLLTP